MIQVATKIKLIDNSGARLCEIIRLLGGNKKKLKNLGDLSVVTIKKLKNKQGKIKKGQVLKFRILRKKNNHVRKDGSYLKFDDKGGVLLNDQLGALGSRIFGPLIRELKIKHSKITSLAKKLI